MDVLILNLVKWLAGLAIPALLARFVRRRWLVVTLAGWALLPMLVVLGLFPGRDGAHSVRVGRAWEASPGAAVLRRFPDYVPWLVMSAAGFAIGLALRQGHARAVASVATAARAPTTTTPYTPVATSSHAKAAASPRAPAQLVASPPTVSEWRARHIGFERDGLILDGLDVWGSQWRGLGGEIVELPHLAHPQQRHRFRIYEAGNGARARQFAAAELSNGVWGFYTRAATPDDQAGTSTDGSLGYENRHAGHAPAGRIWRVATGEVLADVSGWTASEPGDTEQTVRCSSRCVITTTMRCSGLDPRTDSFMVVGEARPEEPLAQLAEAVDRALREGTERARGYLGRRLSPDGTIRVELAMVEWSNTHWVNSPRVTDVATGRIMLDLWNTDWDAEVSFPVARVVLDLRRYHAGGGCGANLHIDTDLFEIFERVWPFGLGR